MDIYQQLDNLAIPYQKFEHQAVFTCEQASALNLDIEGIQTKNLFIKDRKGKRHFLVVLPDEKSLNLKELSVLLEVNGLNLASPDRLARYLATTPGAVSILDILKDVDDNVELVIDTEVWLADAIQCHPYTNTATISMKLTDMQKLLQAHNKVPKLIII